MLVHLLLMLCSRAWSACVEVNSAQSNGWLDSKTGVKLFSLEFKVTDWVPMANVMITWPGDTVTLQHVYNAQQAVGDGASPLATSMLQHCCFTIACEISHGCARVGRCDSRVPAPGNSHVVTLGRTANNPPSFVVMGTGSTNTQPNVMCSTGAITSAPPPMPPGVVRCPLQPHYAALNTWFGANPGENVEVRMSQHLGHSLHAPWRGAMRGLHSELTMAINCMVYRVRSSLRLQIKFGAWKDSGLVNVLYWGQMGMSLENIIGATVHGTTVVNGKDTLVTLQLGTLCEDQVVGGEGRMAATPGQQTNCVPHRAETMHVTFNLRPPASHKPIISCNELSLPPPPPTRQSVGAAPSPTPAYATNGGYVPEFRPPSPPKFAPPPAIATGTTLRSSPECLLSSLAKVNRLEDENGYLTADISIMPVKWVEGATLVLGVTGVNFDLGDKVVRAALVTTHTLLALAACTLHIHQLSACTPPPHGCPHGV